MANRPIVVASVNCGAKTYSENEVNEEMMKSSESGATAHLVSVPIDPEASANHLQTVINAVADSQHCLLHIVCADSTSASELVARIALAFGSPAVQAESEPVVERRKRGGPRKHRVSEQPDSTLIPGAAYRAMLEAAGNDAPRRGPGRPKKNPVASSEEQAGQEGLQ